MQNGQPANVIAPNSVSQEADWKYDPTDSATETEPSATDDSEIVSWSASEFIAHEKSAGWYMLLMLGAVISAGLVYLLTKDIISTVVVIIVLIIFGIFAARKPRELNYVVDGQGIKIADKYYPYATFRSFSVIQEAGVESIWFMPLKKFKPPITIYFAPQDGEKISSILVKYLPMENRKLDQVDKLMHSIRF